MSEPTSDALFGADGTQALPPLPDPSAGPGSGSWRDAPDLPPISLPPLPDLSAMREAIAAALDDDADAPAGEVGQDPTAAPASQAAPQPAGQPTVPDANVPNNVPNNVPAPPHSPTSAGASPGAPTGRPAPTEAGDRSSPRRPTISALIPPAPPWPRRPGGLRYRPPMAGASRESMPRADLRGRTRREHVGLPLGTDSNGGATTFFLVMLIIIGLLVYNIVTGFLDSLSRFLPW